MRADQLALQLYTVRDACSRDFLGTLAEVAAMGYKAVETAGLHGAEANRVRATLDEQGLRAVSAHVPLDRFEGELKAVVRELQTLGCEYAIVPWIPDARRNAEGIRDLATKLNSWGRSLAGEGLRVGYHNHDFEFRPLGDTTLWDMLAGATDPEQVILELDIGWVHFAGQDPAAVLARYAGRVPLVHLKEFAPDGKSDVPAGSGSYDWGALLPAAEAAGARWFIAEQDRPASPLDDARRAYELMSGHAA